MNDLKLNENHDLDFTDGNLYLLNNEAEVAKQTLKISLLTFKGEWFMNLDRGVPYFQEIFTGKPSKEAVDTIFRTTALSSYNIERINIFNSFISKDRVYTINKLEAVTKTGEILSLTNQQIQL